MIGRFNRVLVLQEKAPTPDGGGGFALEWSDLGEVHAEIAAAGKDTHKITLRYQSNLTADMRLMEGADIYHILSVQDPDGRLRIMEVTAEKRTN